ncbi:MAG: diacylglycerol/lipid kinase family protein [Leucobacter sp.]
MLVHPAAGRGRGARIGEAAILRLQSLGAQVRVFSGATAEETKRLATEAVESRPDALAVVGGDGTLALILDRVMGSVVPIALGPEAVDFAVRGRIRDIDVGEAECADGRARFLTIAALGFDARVAQRTNRMRRPRGPLRYYLALVVELVRLRPVPFVLTVDGAAERRPGILIAIGNTRSYGGGMSMCPDADPCDGLFDVTHVASIGRLRLLRLFPLLLRAKHLGRAEVTTLRCRSIEVSAPGLVAYADGERLGEGSFRFRVIPGVLPVLVP